LTRIEGPPLIRVVTAKTATPGNPAHPFLKWVGGKRQLLPEIARYVPRTYGTYHEPFVGAGALFFDLQPRRARLTDGNARLIRAYAGVRNGCDKVIDLLRSYPHTRDFYLRLRTIDIDARPDEEVAAWLIYLNRTGYNGLYRVNSRNEFNVPFGNYAKPKICDAANLRACSLALQHARIDVADFAEVLRHAKSGDFVYFDPPYVPLSATSSFTSYTMGGFGMDDQRRLRDVAVALAKRGVRVLISNSSSPAVRELYADFEQHEVSARRAVNCNAAGRKAVTELLIR
jgi:DNA adenine methylase